VVSVGDKFAESVESLNFIYTRVLYKLLYTYVECKEALYLTSKFFTCPYFENMMYSSTTFKRINMCVYIIQAELSVTKFQLTSYFFKI